MSLPPALASERVKVYRAVLVPDDPGTPAVDESMDDYGNPVRAEEPAGGAPEEEQVAAEHYAAVRPVDATEEELNRDTRISRYNVYLPPHVELDGLSRLEWAGRTFQVVGEPELVTGLAGRQHHLRVLVREVLG